MSTQPQPNAEIVERTSTFERVASEALANTFSGVGLGLLSGVALWAVGCGWATIATWATASAIAWAGVINWIRFSQDELGNQLTFWRMARDITELSETVAALESEVSALTDRNAWLEQRAKQPLRINGVPQEPETDPAYKDAEALIRKRYAQGVPVTARHMMSAGWSQARYTAALDVLKSAGVVTLRGTQAQWSDYPSPEGAIASLYAITPVVLNGNTSIQAGGAD